MSQSPQPRYSALELRQATLAPAPSTARRCHVPPAGKWRVAMTNVDLTDGVTRFTRKFRCLTSVSTATSGKTNRSRGPWRFGCCCCCETHSAQPPDPQARGPLSLWHSLRLWTELGGVADTTCYYTGRAAGAVQHNAHALRTPKHGGRYRNGRRRGLGRHPQGLSERPVGLQSHHAYPYARTSTSRARARGGMPAGRASDHGLICT